MLSTACWVRGTFYSQQKDHGSSICANTGWLTAQRVEQCCIMCYRCAQRGVYPYTLLYLDSVWNKAPKRDSDCFWDEDSGIKARGDLSLHTSCTVKNSLCWPCFTFSNKNTFNPSCTLQSATFAKCKSDHVTLPLQTLQGLSTMGYLGGSQWIPVLE